MESLSSVISFSAAKFRHSKLSPANSLIATLNSFSAASMASPQRRPITQTLSARATVTSAPISSSASETPKKVLVPIAFGTEEMEAVIITSILRQAGAQVTVASVELRLDVEGSAGTALVADTFINDCQNQIFDLVALPGGMPGSVRLRDCEVLQKITVKQAMDNRLYGAICAAPAVTLLPWGLTTRKQTTCHPAFMDKLPTFWAVNSNVQVSNGLTTSRGPGTSFEFALSLVQQLFGEAVARNVGESVMVSAEEKISRKEEFNAVEWPISHKPCVLIPVANGSDAIEVVTIADILRRGKLDVLIGSLEKSVKISASRGVWIMADKTIHYSDDTEYDLIVIPGGPGGTNSLNKSRILKTLLKKQETAGRVYGAVCSAPQILNNQGFLKNKKVTANPSIFDKLTDVGAVRDTKVVIDGKLITSKGLSTAMEFSLAIIGKFFGHARARSVAAGLVYEYPRSG